MKVELGCKTWAEPLEKLVRLEPKHAIPINVEEAEQIKMGVESFLNFKMWCQKDGLGR